jgi:hypothetical protein
MLIKNYGLFWRRESIFWGKGRNAGHLKGVLSTARSGKPVNFREQQGVYILYDEGFRLVYVGQAGGKNKQRLFKRLEKHRKDHLADRWQRFSWFGVRAVNDTGKLHAETLATHTDLPNVLNHIEAILIEATEPLHNSQGGRFGKKVQQYLQWRDVAHLGPEIPDMVRELWKARSNES